MKKGMEIHEKLRAELPGYLVPRYVVDVVGMPYKQNVAEHSHFFFQEPLVTPSISMA